MNHPQLPRWQLFALPAVAIMLLIFYIGKYFVADELIYANYHVEALQKDLQTTLEQLEEEKTLKTIAQREADVVRQANDLLRDSERQRQDEIASLKADLAFYRRLGGASGSQAPLAVHHVELLPTRSPRVFRLVLTLTQNLRWASIVSGQVQIGVDGIKNGVAEQLDNQQLLAEAAEPLHFRFKYFQQLERLITLPEGFEPNRLTIRLRTGGSSSPAEQSSEWRNLFRQTVTAGSIE